MKLQTILQQIPRQYLNNLVYTSSSSLTATKTTIIRTSIRTTPIRSIFIASLPRHNRSNMETQQYHERDQSNMSIIDIIKQDHRDAIAQHNLYKSSTNIDEKKKAAQMAIKLIAVHSVCEEQVLYPAYRQKLSNGDALADQSIEEHQQLKNDLYELDKMDINDPQFDSQFNKVMDDVNLHGIEHEEKEFLPLFASKCTHQELVEMGAKFVGVRKIAPTHPHPMAPTQPTFQKMAAAVATPLDKMKDLAEGV